MSAFDNLPLVIEPAQLAERLDAADLILLDLSSAARYAAGHIPGARWVDTKRTQLGVPPAPGAAHAAAPPPPTPYPRPRHRPYRPDTAAQSAARRG